MKNNKHVFNEQLKEKIPLFWDWLIYILIDE